VTSVKNVTWKSGCAILFPYCVQRAGTRVQAFQPCVTLLKRLTLIMGGNGREYTSLLEPEQTVRTCCSGKHKVKFKYRECSASNLTETTLPLQGNMMLFTTNHQHKVAMRSSRNCLDCCPPCLMHISHLLKQ
jgi:hypothetical protein